MVIILSIIGLIAAAWVWENVNPMAGLVVGFLFVGGAGWKALGFLAGSMRPTARQAYGAEGREFIAAWEEHFGPIFPGGPNHPPPGAFQKWLKARRKTSISADAWIDGQLYPQQSLSGSLSSKPSSLAEPESWITAYCEVLTNESARVEYPLRMVVDADEDGLTVSLRSGDPSFDIEWNAVYACERSKSPTGEPIWLLILDADSTAVPRGVRGLKVIEVHSDDEQRWEHLLGLMASDEEE